MATSVGAANAVIAKDPKLQIQRFHGLRSYGSIPLNRRVNVLPASSSNSSLVTATATPVKTDVIVEPKRSKVEIFKEQSNFIRYPLNEELLNELIKFHGSYMQTNRDERGTKSYQFMLRTKNPLQTFQLHGVLKKNLKTVMSTIIRNMGLHSWCMRKDYLFAQETADNIAALLSPQSGFYYDMWVDARNDNTHGTNFPDSPELIYGTQFLPRKFKVAVTVPGDNSVDILTNDIGVVVVSDAHGEPQVGGGMGRTHRIENTFPRLAEPLGYVPKEDILYAVKAIVVTQRENGRRDERRYSRMKYLISEWGIEKFRNVVEQYYGKKFEPFRELPEWEFKSYLGWHESRYGDGELFCGLHVDNGEIIAKYDLSVRLTPNQNIILCDIRPAWRRPITTALAQAGLLLPRYVDPLNATGAMACPALPLCPLAITEAERGIPDLLKRVRAVFDKVGLKYSESVVIRVTGCPNGCARPYMAELGLVDDGPNSYQIWLGGTPGQTVLARPFMNKVKIQELEKGFEKLQEIVDKWEGPAEAPARFNLRLFGIRKHLKQWMSS
ncbi:hypothetical protein MKW92_028748 [Papaver armeniacum]|nr:hypothetical protein MKW92_028748 [Papaver armeniacum]